ncbi:MAG: alpha/beta fold hydrolase [Alphaproteobacteria bacterium]|nr:alpha/beta fold hydrolase [Alphaproteobacteria bacterium]
MRSFAGRARRRLGALALALLATAAAAAVPVAAGHAETQIFSLYDFQFEDGSVMPELRIGYETRGTLSPARDNAIVLLHDTFADHHAFDAETGPGGLFDTNRYFVIAIDALGSGDSSSPSDGTGQDFPRYTIRDMMKADSEVVSRGLGIGRPRAIVGRSMGAAIALEWAAHHPEAAAGLVLLAPSAASDTNFQLLIDLLTSAVALDPDWAGGRYERNPIEGLRHAGMIYYPWSVTAPYLDALSPAALAQETEVVAKNFAGWDANALVLRCAAARGHDLAGGAGGSLDAALAPVTMPVLLMPSRGDRLVDGANARLLRGKLAQARYAEIPGDVGHRGIAAAPGTPEGDFIVETVRAFLK